MNSTFFKIPTIPLFSHIYIKPCKKSGIVDVLNSRRLKFDASKTGWQDKALCRNFQFESFWTAGLTGEKCKCYCKFLFFQVQSHTMTCIVGIPNPIFSYDHPPTGLHNASSKSSNLQLTGDSGSNAWWYCLILIAFKCKYKFFFVNDIYFRTSSFISRKLKKNGKYLVNL